VAIFVLGLAEMLGVDLEEEINAKMSSNLRRRCVRSPDCQRSPPVSDGAPGSVQSQDIGMACLKTSE
jgi:hypothetical protein